MTTDQTLPLKIGRMRRNRDVLFFVLNALGWLSWGLGQYVGFALYTSSDYPFATLTFVASGGGFLLTALLRYVCRILWRQPPATLIVGGLISALLFALPLRAIINSFELYLEKGVIEFDHWYDLFMGTMWGMYLIVCWMGLYFGFHFYELNRYERETALRATALAQSAQLKMLRYQLNPHFLFNTLNAISTLVLDQRNAIANTVVTRLADFLRYTLDQDPMKTVTLAQEMSALNLYLDIEKMRFGARLTVEIEIDSAAGSASVPSLVLQPLIENAVKYAISPREEGGRIRIIGRLAQQDVVLTVEDDGPGVVDTGRIDSGRGVGLRNTRERLYAMYGARAKVELSNSHPGLRITLQFPQHP